MKFTWKTRGTNETPPPPPYTPPEPTGNLTVILVCVIVALAYFANKERVDGYFSRPAVKKEVTK